MLPTHLVAIYLNLRVAATSSYIILPPPYSRAYSVGGPSGEVHLIDPSTGGFGDQLQRVLFVPENELPNADKTKVALVCHRYLILFIHCRSEEPRLNSSH